MTKIVVKLGLVVAGACALASCGSGVATSGHAPTTTTPASSSSTEPSTAGNSGDTGSSSNEQVTAAESDLQTALTAAKTYYTENNQSYEGFDARVWAGLQTGLSAVFGSPSTGPNVISVRPEQSGTAVELTAYAPLFGGCFGILDVTANLPRPLFPDRPSTGDPGTYYFASAASTDSICTASVSSAPYFSANGFDFGSSGPTGNSGTGGNTGVTGSATGNTGPPSTAVSAGAVCGAVSAYSKAWASYVKTGNTGNLVELGANLGIAAGEYGAPFGADIVALTNSYGNNAATTAVLARMTQQCETLGA